MESIFKTDRRIKLGIWGLGRGLNFIEAAKFLNIDVVAGCDINPRMRENFRQCCPEALVTDDEEVFLNYDLDAILVATYFGSHAEHSMRALRAGKHVMCEVTSFFTPAEGVRLVEAVEASGKVYNLLENYPFTKENMFLAKLWGNGFFGEFEYGEFEYLHECRLLAYAYNISGKPGVEPGWTAHSWRSWLNFHYYNTHSLGPLMRITGLRPELITALPSEVSLPGYLEGSRMGGACPSLIKMSNGGLCRNLMGSTTSDSHTGKRIWGTRASAESLGHGLFLRVGAHGGGLKLAVTPQWPELAELADTAAHGGGDFWELYYFARQVLTGEAAPWDIYHACDVTLAGIMAVKSESLNGAPVVIPDFRDRLVREQFRHDDFQQRHFDPEQIFPEGHDRQITGKFSGLMGRLCASAPQVRTALDGMALYSYLAEEKGKLEILRRTAALLAALPETAETYREAEALADAYPDSAPARAIRELLELGEAGRFREDIEAFAGQLNDFLKKAGGK